MEKIIIADDKVREQLFSAKGSIGKNEFKTNAFEAIELNHVFFCEVYLEIQEKYVMIYDDYKKRVSAILEREKLNDLYIKKEIVVSETVEKEFKF